MNLKDLLEILACPACKTPVHLSEDETAIICDRCRRRYPIRDGIPVMLVEEAEEPAA
ncbi:MAG: Trm112 family protein [Candidatus Coatesbacteria bacterium]|nr:Trm112 family protein [Candidatus Coatesbacteria bacterium]